MGKCECGRLKGNPCGPLQPNTINVTMPMRKLGMEDRSGSPRGDRTRLRNQMDRLFHSHVQLIYEDEQHKASVSSQVADRTDLWWNPKRPNEPSLWDSKVLLSEAFFNEIITTPYRSI